jgi:hypothetical protein
MLRSICIAVLIVFALELFNLRNVVDVPIAYVRERAKLTQNHGVKGLFNDIWCGDPKCSKK